MKYVSLFSGIEAVSVAWNDLGWEPIAFSEIEPFPCEVLRQRFSDVPNLGDITQIDWTPYVGTVDLIVGGSPCQSFSVAGKREGLKGESGLMFEYIRAVREICPKWFVWENVPGALTSEHGGAFGQLLAEMDDIGYGMAWRVLDAQFFGVAQRRRRVFLVGCLGNPERAAKVLFDGESLCWDFTSSRKKREEITRNIESGITESCYAIQGDIARGAHLGQNGKGWSNDGTSYTQNTIDQHAVAYLPFNTTQITNLHNGNNPQWDDPCHCLASTDHPPAVCMTSTNSHGEIDNNLCGTLTHRSYKDAPVIASNYVVRRLMPIECERLQGFPDGWTDIKFKGKSASDTARYKALGNSMAVPVMRWIGERIAQVNL